MQKNAVKFGAGVLGLAAFGAAVFYGMQWYENRNSPEYALKQEYEKLMEAYKNDTYGGGTPEETLRLFIDALKAGDTDLAAKYFVVEEQEKRRNYLQEIKQRDNFQMAIADLARLKLSKQTDEEAFYTAVGDRGVVELQVIFSKNSITNKWKILEL